MKPIHTEIAPPPFSKYSQGFRVDAGADIVFVSGQVGALPDGTLLEGDEAQNLQVWRNILEILKADNMGAADVVEVTAYLKEGGSAAICRRVREEMLGDARPASTMLFVPALASPDWLVEISVVAAKAR